MNAQNSQPTQIESEDSDLPPAGGKENTLTINGMTGSDKLKKVSPELKTLIRFWGRNKMVLSLICPKTIYLLG